MLRILVANSKGGCGKSTLSTNLAGHFARQGRSTTLVDSDPQGSSAAWCASRPSHLARVHCLTSNDSAPGFAAGWLLRVPSATEVLLIDTPAGLRMHELAPMFRHADVVLVPIVPSALDLRVTLAFLDKLCRLPEVRSGTLRVALVVNRLRSRTLAARELEGTLQRLAQAALLRMRDSQAYVTLAAQGRSLFDDDSSALRGHREDWTTLLEWLDGQLKARVDSGKVTRLIPATTRNLAG